MINTLDVLWWSFSCLSKEEICKVCNIYRSQYNKLRNDYYEGKKEIISDVYDKTELWQMWNSGQIEKDNLPGEMQNEINILRRTNNPQIEKYDRNGIKISSIHVKKIKEQPTSRLYATGHVYKRLQERFGIKENVDAFITKALDEGFIVGDKKRAEYLCYGKCKFVICKNKLITVYDRFGGKW